MRPSTIAVGALLTLLPASASAKIGIVDIDRCVRESEDGMRAQAALTKFADRRQATIELQEASLKQQATALGQMSIASPTFLLARAKYQAAFDAYQRTVERFSKEIADREIELFSPIESSVRAVVERFGAAGGFDVILERSKLVIVPAASAIDVTERVIAAYDWRK